MTTPYDDRQQNYWEASRRVRESWARFELGNLLFWAFDPEFSTLPEDRLEDFISALRDRVGAAEPAWKPAMDALRGIPVTSLRGDLKQAFATIRELARNVATSQPTGIFRMRVDLFLSTADRDRDGRPAWYLDGRLRDGLVWMAVKLFSEVPRSLIRTCGFAHCPRVYVAGKNQRYCLGHQADAQRQTQRRAERAFRHRARKRRSR
jgi:hypothetical protein